MRIGHEKTGCDILAKAHMDGLIMAQSDEMRHLEDEWAQTEIGKLFYDFMRQHGRCGRRGTGLRGDHTNGNRRNLLTVNKMLRHADATDMGSNGK